MQARFSGPWSADEVHEHLASAHIPARLACRNPEGYPLVVSLWYLHRDDALWCATQNDALVARCLGDDPRCGFEVAADRPPYRGVRGWGRAEIVSARGEEILRALIERYLGDERSSLARWLLSRADREVALRIVPERWVSWDYGERMQEAS